MRTHLSSCCTCCVTSRPASGTVRMLLPMTNPATTGMTWVQPSPLSTTTPVSRPLRSCRQGQRRSVGPHRCMAAAATPSSGHTQQQPMTVAAVAAAAVCAASACEAHRILLLRRPAGVESQHRLHPNVQPRHVKRLKPAVFGEGQAGSQGQVLRNREKWDAGSSSSVPWKRFAPAPAVPAPGHRLPELAVLCWAELGWAGLLTSLLPCTPDSLECSGVAPSG